MRAPLTTLFRAFLLCIPLGVPSFAQRADERYFYEDIFHPFFVKDDAAGVFRPQRPGATASPFSIQKSPDAFRVFVIGGSIAQRYMGGTDNLEAALEEVLPNKRIEAINCGMGGYDSYREEMIVREVLGYSPDLIVLMTGHNERYGYRPPPLWMQSLLRLMKRWEYRALQRNPGDAADIVSRSFEGNLRRMHRLCRAKGVPILTISPPLNYRDGISHFPPPLGDASFIGGWIKYLRRDYKGTLKDWEIVLNRPTKTSVDREGMPAVLFLMGRAAERLSRQEEANRYYQRAISADEANGRCGPSRQETIRRLLSEEGGIWADVDGAFKRAASPRLPGLDFFDDAVHWFHDRDRIVSKTIVDTLRRDDRFSMLPWREGRAEPKTLKREQVRALDDETLETLRYALAEIHSLDVNTHGFSWRAVVYLEAVSRRHPEWFRDIPSLIAMAETGSEMRGKAWGMPPISTSPALMFWHRGEVRMLGGRFRDAVADFSEAARLGAPLPGVRFSLAYGQFMSGNAKGARRSLTEVRGPGWQPAVSALLAASGGSILLDGGVPALDQDAFRRVEFGLADLGQFQRALEFLDRLIRRAPAVAAYRNDRGFLLLRMGRSREAEPDLRAAISLDPDLADPYLSLGALLAATGRTAEAGRLYDSALANRNIRASPQTLTVLRREREKMLPRARR